MAIAEKYRVDLDHARDVADLAVRLFDELQADHGLGPRHRLLLRVAGLLHEVGGFVSSRAHHKHSYYLISQLGDLRAQPRRDRRSWPTSPATIAAASPSRRTSDYMSLPRETRVVINKLAAMLRVADALARGHATQAPRPPLRARRATS